MGHGHHHHDDDHSGGDYSRAFAVGVLLNIIYIVVEVAAGFWFGSLALLADAGHNITDVVSLLLAWAGHYLAGLKPTSRHTYGWRSASILAAFVNGLLLLVAVGGIAWEAVRRLGDPVAVHGGSIMAVAGLGVVINTATALMFLKGRNHDVNIRGAFLHMAADAGVSAAVVVAGLLTMTFGWVRADPVTGLLIAVAIFASTWSLLKESTNLALAAVPENIDPAAIRTFLKGLPDVAELHDLHIWGMSTTTVALTVHLIVPERRDTDALLMEIYDALDERFGIEHATIQIERSDRIACRHAPAEVV